MEMERLLFLAVAGSSILISLGTLAAVIRTPGLRFKAFWSLLSLVGLGGMVMVWGMSDGIFGFFGIAIPVAWVEFSEAGWQPELVRFLYPVGALVVIARIIWHRRKRAARSTAG